jgi:hypothetical protein
MPGFFWTRYYPCKRQNNGGVLRLDRGRSGYDSSSSSLAEESALAADVRECFDTSVIVGSTSVTIKVHMLCLCIFRDCSSSVRFYDSNLHISFVRARAFLIS